MSSQKKSDAFSISSSSGDDKSHDDDAHNRPKCPICLSIDYDGDKALIKGCYHAFCLFCIMQWAEMSKSCPICKSKISKLIINIDDKAETFTVLDLDSAEWRSQKATKKSASIQQISQNNMRRILRAKIYANRLKPTKLFEAKVPFGAGERFYHDSSLLKNEKRNWRRKVELWIQSEAPIALNHHLAHSVDESTKEQEIMMLKSLIIGLMEKEGDLRGSRTSRNEIESLLGADDAEIFIRDIMNFLMSSFKTPNEYDRLVRYTKTGNEIDSDEAISVHSSSASSFSSDNDASDMEEVGAGVSCDQDVAFPPAKRRKTQTRDSEDSGESGNDDG